MGITTNVTGVRDEFLNWEANFKNTWPYSGQIYMNIGGAEDYITCYIYFSAINRSPVYLPFIHGIYGRKLRVYSTMY